jgi:TolA-binding protein
MFGGVRGRAPGACREAMDALVRGAPGAEVALRAERHRQGCPACQARAAELETVARAVDAVDARLDDVTRARMSASLEAAYWGQPAAKPVWRAGRRSVWRWALLPAGAVAAAAAAFVIARPHFEESRDHGEIAATAPALIRPYRITSPAMPADEADRLLARGASRFDVPGGAKVRARLTDRVRVTLVGPARLEVLGANDDVIELGLPYGTLLGDYDHRTGGTLRIRSPRMTVEIVGTVFAIEARARGSRLSVSHGIVSAQVEGRTDALLVRDRQSLDTDADTAKPIDAPISGLLDEHEGETDTPEPREPAPAVAPVPAAAAAPAHADSAGPSPKRAAAGVDRERRRAMAPAVRKVALATAPSMQRRAPSGVETELAPRPTPPLEPIPAPVAPIRATPPPVAAPASPPPAVSPPTLAPSPPAVRPPSASDLYEVAEASMARGDRNETRQRLQDVIARHPNDTLADLAHQELAQLALRGGDFAGAAREVAEIIARGRDPAVVEAAHYLRCRILLERGGDEGVRCLERFRAERPMSARDAEALIELVARASQVGRCAQAKPLAAEYLERYPSGSFRKEAQRAQGRCAAPSEPPKR